MMEPYTRKCKAVCRLLAVLLSINLSAENSFCKPVDANTIRYNLSSDYESFYRHLEEHDCARAVLIGDSIFRQMEREQEPAEALSIIRRKLAAAASLSEQMELLLKQETERQMWAAIELFENENKRRKERLPAVPSARTFCESHMKLFSEPVTNTGLDDKARDFLKHYYDLKVKLYVDAVAKAGRALHIADPGFTGTHDYVLVLPLLHALENVPLPTDVLPEWMCQARQLAALSDSCLFHFGFPSHAMTLAKQAARTKNEVFCELDFYRRAAQRCLKKSPHTTIQCLQSAVEVATAEDVNVVKTLRLELAQKCLDTGNYSLASMQAQKLLDDNPDDDTEFGRFTWLYFYSLAQNRNIDRLLADIDTAIEDKRCKSYKARLLYTKWWALRHKPEESARVAALEHTILQQYNDHPLAAQILLYQAENLLSEQRYDAAAGLLREISDKFPATEAAAKARTILTETANKTN